MASSGTIKTTETSRDPGYYGELSWKIQSTSGNTTTIAWDAYLKGTAAGWTTIAQSQFKVSCSKGTINGQTEYTKTILSYDTSRHKYINDKLGSGTFTVTHNSSAEASFSIEFKIAIFDWSLNCTGSSTITLPTLYTKCGAPTTVTLPSVIVPSQQFTITWSGATNGTNNPIKDYSINLWYNKTTDQTPSETLASNTTTVDITKTLAALGNVRGAKVYVKVKANGNAGTSYDSEWSSAFDTKINSLPSTPTLSATSQTISSTSSGYSCTATAGTDIDASQSVSVYYATSATGSKVRYTTPQTINPTSGTSTYYFWSYDGYEYSSNYATCAVTRNIKPTISINMASTTVTTYLVNNNNGTLDSRLGWANKIRPVLTLSKTGTYTIDVQMHKQDSTAFTSDKIFNIKNAISTSTTSVNVGELNIDAVIGSTYSLPLGTTPVAWRLRIKMNDGIEDSNYIYFPGGTNHYAIAGDQVVLNKYNQHANNNVTGSISGNMYKLARFTLPYDASCLTRTISAQTGNINLSTSATYSVSDGTLIVNAIVNDPQNIPSGETINFTITQSNNNISKQSTVSMVSCLKPTLTNFAFGRTTIKPFTATTSTFESSIAWPFGSYASLDAAKGPYEFASLSLIQSYSNNKHTINITPVKSADSLKFTMNDSVVYTFGTLGIADSNNNYSGTNQISQSLVFTNVYGMEINSNALNLTLDFREAPQSVSITEIRWSKTKKTTVDSTWTTLTTGKKIQEGAYLAFHVNAQLFTRGAITKTLYIDRGDGKGKVSMLTETSAAGSLMYATDKNPVTNEFWLIYGPVQEIVNTRDRNWFVNLQYNSTYTKTSDATLTSVIRFTQPNVVLSGLSADEPTAITYTYSRSDTGGGHITTYLYADGQNITNAIESNVTTTVTNKTGTMAVLSTIPAWTVKPISLRTISKITAATDNCLFDATKNFYTQNIVVYVLMPTLAYRQNALGINTKTVKNDAVLDIYQTTGKDRILFEGKDINGKTMELSTNISTGMIELTQDGVITGQVDMLHGGANIEIGGTNLLSNSAKYQADSKLTYSGKTKDVAYSDTHSALADIVATNLVAGVGYVFQFTTDGVLGSHITDGSGGGVTHPYPRVYFKDGTNGYIQFRGDNAAIGVKTSQGVTYLGTRPADGGLTAMWSYIPPKDVDQFKIRLDVHGDGVNTYTVSWWNFKLERGNKATDWSPNVTQISGIVSRLATLHIAYKATGTGTNVQLNVPVIGSTNRNSIFFFGNGNGIPHFGVVYYQGNGTSKIFSQSLDGPFTLTPTYENGVLTIDGFRNYDGITFIGSFEFS